jgi:hypothetical protein
MFTQMVFPHHWLQLSTEDRAQLRKDFAIPRTGGSEVINNVVKSDGTTIQDLGHLTVEKMQAFLGSKEADILKLLEMVIKKYHGNGDPERHSRVSETITRSPRKVPAPHVVNSAEHSSST